MPGPITVWSHTDHRTRIAEIPLARLLQVVADRDRGSPCALQFSSTVQGVSMSEDDLDPVAVGRLLINLGAAMLQGRVRHHAGRRAVV